MPHDRREDDHQVTRKECQKTHDDERSGRRWVMGILATAILVLFGWGVLAAETNGAQSARLAERAKGEERILEKLDKIETLLMQHVAQHGKD